MKSNFLLSALAVSALSAALSACSDDSSTKPSEEILSSSSSSEGEFDHCEAMVPECGYDSTYLCSMGISEYCKDSIPTVNPDIPVITPPGDTTEPAVCVAAPVEFPLNEFVDVGDVYKAIQCNEKVVFAVRHGDREPGVGIESPLIENGILESIAMGEKLMGPDDFAFVHSGFVRTYQTTFYIAQGRGQANFVDDTIPELADGWYLKDKELRDYYNKADSHNNVNVMYALWAYEGKYSDVFYDLETKSEELIHTYLVKDYAQMPKYTVVASHDQVLMPLTVYATQKQIDLKLHEVTSRNWLNNLAGVAIIINDKNELRYVPIKGSNSGVQ